MNQTYETPEAFANAIVREAKGKWVNGSFEVAGQLVDIKAYGLWIQVMVTGSIRDGGDFRTQRDMKAYIRRRLGA